MNLDGFHSAQPFPHAILDNFVDAETVAIVNAEWGAVNQWNEHSHTFSQKRGSRGPFGKVTTDLIAVLNEPSFVKALAEATGIDGLSADASLFGGGLHETFTGGFLGIHADFNLHPETQYLRRLNLLLFLNELWDKTWGGFLELHGPGGLCVSLAPIAGRAVIFETSERSFHGQPQPLACPEGVSRRSLALYYYSEPLVATKPHSTLYLGDEANWPLELQPA